MDRFEITFNRRYVSVSASTKPEPPPTIALTTSKLGVFIQEWQNTLSF